MRDQQPPSRRARRSCAGGSCRVNVGKGGARGGAPEALEVVVEAGALVEDVDDEGTIVEQHPFAGVVAFAVTRLPAMAGKLLLDFVADGLRLARAEARGEHEGTGKSA